MIMIQTNTNVKKLIQFVLKLLAKRDHFKSEILLKLKEKGAQIEEIDEVIEYIDKFGYIDEKRTLSRYAREIAQKGKGTVYFKKKLYEKGCLKLLSEFNIDEYFTREMEEAAAMNFYIKARMKDPLTIQKKLISRGFSSYVVRVVLNKLKMIVQEYED